MSDPENGGGGIPPLGRGPTLAEEEKELKKGNTGILVGGAVFALVVLAGVIFLLAQEQPDQYGTVGGQVNTLKSEHFDRFWACALPNEPLDRMRSNGDLSYAVTKRAERNPGMYARHVRERCMQKLNSHQAPLQVVIAPPQDLTGQLRQLGDALEDLKTSWDEYLRYLEHAEDYDEDDARPHLSKVAKGWFDYKRAHRAVNQTIGRHVNQ